MDECLEILDERKECLNDDFLVQQVRLHLILEKLALGTLFNSTMDSIDHRRLVVSYNEKLYFQFQVLKTSLLKGSSRNGKLLRTVRYMTLSHVIKEAVLLYLYSIELEITSSTIFYQSNELAPQQRKSATAALESINSWLPSSLR